jgi:hypothetical protein
MEAARGMGGAEARRQRSATLTVSGFYTRSDANDHEVTSWPNRFAWIVPPSYPT